MALNLDSATWQLTVNGVNKDGARAASTLMQELVHLRLHQGDVMLLGLPPARGSLPIKTTEAWLSGFCQSNSIAVYLLPEPFPGVDMFSVRAYHWAAPYHNPFDLGNATFLCEGRLIGHSTNGFERMLDQITRDRPRQVFILGSLFDMGRSFPPDPSPYYHERDRLYDVLKAARTDFIQLDALPGF